MRARPAGAEAVSYTHLLQHALGEYDFVLQPVLQVIREAAMSAENPEVILGGEGRLLEQPEFHDLDKTREFLDFLQDNESRRQVLSPAEGHEGITITCLLYTSYRMMPRSL